jgi:hypothetical protein
MGWNSDSVVERLWVAVAAVGIALSAQACAPKVELFLDVRTDLVAGIEFRNVKTEVFAGLPSVEDDASEERTRLRAVGRGEPFVDGVRVAELEELDTGVYHVRVRLLDSNGTAVLQRIATITLRETSVFTITLTRDCRGVMCPDAADPAATACLGGRCVDPRCTDETPEYCGPPACTSDAECGVTASCAEARCGGGACLAAGEVGGACAVGEWCNPDLGCADIPGGAVAVSGYSSCALRASGELYCWGGNYAGEVGVGGFEPQPTPAAVAPAMTFVDVSAGSLHHCAASTSGGVLCWGSNGNGDLGTGDYTERDVPTAIAVPGTVAVLSSASSNNTAVLDDGQRWSWGDNRNDGALGIGDDLGPRIDPVVALGTGWRSTDLGWSHGCGIQSDGSLWCWGRGFVDYGFSPALQSPGPWAAVSVSDGRDNLCVIDDAGALFCWGDNAFGAVGTANESEAEPVRIEPDRRFIAVSCGFFATCAIDVFGTLLCWGTNDSGILGVGDRRNRRQPAVVSPERQWVAVAVAEGHACGIQADDSVWCWGNGSDYALGTGDDLDRLEPARVVF